MKLFQKLLKFCSLLDEKGYNDEASILRRVLAHYAPESKKHLPEFFRKNYDYGEGFYHGDMSDKKSVEDFRKKHKEKGPNWKKKDKKKKK